MKERRSNNEIYQWREMRKQSKQSMKWKWY